MRYHGAHKRGGDVCLEKQTRNGPLYLYAKESRFPFEEWGTINEL
jgi:hypothetical protein